MTLRFASVGLISTLLYFFLALAFDKSAALSATLASLLAYAIAALFSYVAHRNFTFDSAKPHSSAMPRFFVTTVCGAILALLLPLVLHEWLKLPAFAALLAVSVLVPLTNLVLLRLWVFSQEPEATETKPRSP